MTLRYVIGKIEIKIMHAFLFIARLTYGRSRHEKKEAKKGGGIIEVLKIMHAFLFIVRLTLLYHNVLVIYMVGLKFRYMWPRVLY